MIINETGTLLKVESTQIVYSLYVDGIIYPATSKFVATFTGGDKIQGLNFSEWMYRLLEGKVITKVDDIPSEKLDYALRMVSNTENYYLMVERLDDEYLLSTFFRTLNTLLEQGSELISLEWIK